MEEAIGLIAGLVFLGSLVVGLVVLLRWLVIDLMKQREK